MNNQRDRWSTKLGVILAVAGSAVGLGNFLRFPVQAAQHGGGAFMIPYFVSFLLLGIPLCWVEWTMGRYGGRYSHGSAPGIFQAMWRSPLAKYIGVIGIFGPLLIFFYYSYIESWTLGYAFFSLKGTLTGLQSGDELSGFLDWYLGVAEGSSVFTAYLFFLITFAANFAVVYFGVSRGIERVNKIAMPLLAILGILLTIRVLTLGSPDPLNPDYNVNNALGFIWNPDFSALLKPEVWLAAAGQIFFTLSVGIGVILTYASYLKRDDDVALSSLSASSANGFMEVVIGASVVVVAAAVFFGSQGAQAMAEKGAFSLGFITMPLIFSKILAGWFFCLVWFLLLFIAGLTSSISILQPAIAFLEDEFKFARRKSVMLLTVLCFLMAQFSIFGVKYGLVDELDFWGGNFFLVVFGFVEVVLFGWVFGIDRAWKELNLGANIRLPIFFKYVIKYVTPLFAGIILGSWIYENLLDTLLMKSDAYAGKAGTYILILRIVLLLLMIGILYLIHIAWKLYKRDYTSEGG